MISNIVSNARSTTRGVCGCTREHSTEPKDSLWFLAVFSLAAALSTTVVSISQVSSFALTGHSAVAFFGFPPMFVVADSVASDPDEDGAQVLLQKTPKKHRRPSTTRLFSHLPRPHSIPAAVPSLSFFVLFANRSRSSASSPFERSRR